MPCGIAAPTAGDSLEWQGNYGTGRFLTSGAVMEGTVSLHLQGSQEGRP